MYSRAHDEIYIACLDLHRRGIEPDVVTVATHLRDNGKLEMVEMSYLTTVTAFAPGAGNILTYAKTVANKSSVRKLILASQKIAAEGYAPHGDDSEYMLRAANAIREITRIADKSAITSNKEALRQVFLEIQAASSRGTGVSGIRTGISMYDEFTTGLHGGRLYSVAARPGGGKTSRVVQMITSIAQQGMGVIFFFVGNVKE